MKSAVRTLLWSGSYGAVDAAKAHVARLLIPLLRAYTRYMPIRLGKSLLWDWLGPRVSTRPHRFVASTIFGCKMAGDTRDFLQRYVYYFGVWEPYLTRWISEQLMPGDTFIDVGANVGYYALLAAKQVGTTGAVVAVEVSPTIFSHLRKNLELNHASNVRAVNVAASDLRGRASVYLGPEYHLGVTSILEGPGLEFEGHVDAFPLSTILHPREVGTARLIKIDVEGSEWAVLRGMAPVLGQLREDVAIVVEVEPRRLARQGRSPEDILDLLARFGFHAYTLEHDYSATSCLSPRAGVRPARLRAGVRGLELLVFSRRAAEFL